ncbi:MAG: hypothetical protein IJC19_00140 [Clostridia bacterium]|nr:hypothetical protein [Clostridia bacterium]
MTKKIPILLLISCLLFSFVGCGTVEEITQSSSESAENATTEDSSNTQEDSKTVYFNSLQETGLFEFSYNAEKTVWKRGEEILLRCTMEYIGQEPLPYGGPSAGMDMPYIILYQNSDGSVVLSEESFEIPRGGTNAATTDILSNISNGFTAKCTHKMKTPQDAPLGKYHLILLFQKHCKIFENAIEIVE